MTKLSYEDDAAIYNLFAVAAQDTVAICAEDAERFVFSGDGSQSIAEAAGMLVTAYGEGILEDRRANTIAAIAAYRTMGIQGFIFEDRSAEGGSAKVFF